MTADVYPWSDMDMTVTWGDCDAAGISYYARSFDWFTNGRMHFLAAEGFPYMETFHHRGISLVCLKADCRYVRMLRPDEPVTVRISLASLTRTRMVFHYRIRKKSGELACEGMTSHACVDNKGHPFNLEKRFPQLWRSLADRWSRAEDDGASALTDGSVG